MWRKDRNGANAVRWLSFKQLIRTAREVQRSTLFARYADKREVMSGTPLNAYMLAGTKGTVDYVADTGDGFDATFAVAKLVAHGPRRFMPDPQCRPHPHCMPDSQCIPERGAACGVLCGAADALVIGGDTVYPVASAEEYRRRFDAVFRLASSEAGFETRPRPQVFALPGNHDWYDGLVSFRRTFCESWVREPTLRQRLETLSEVDFTDREFVVNIITPSQPVPVLGTGGLGSEAITLHDDAGGWAAQQSRSYFALQVSRQWWIWAVDSQLDKPIDALQLEYFRRAKDDLGDANLVLCTAKPSWLAYADGAREDWRVRIEETSFFTLAWFIDRLLGDRRRQVRLILTGDEHHYARYVGAAEIDPPLVTCGGGGAYTSATHHLPEELRLPWRPWPAFKEDTQDHVRTYKLGERNLGHGNAVPAVYPTKGQSHAMLNKGFLTIPFRNHWSFVAGVGLLDGLVGSAIVAGPQWLKLLSVASMFALLATWGGAFGAKELRGWRRGTMALMLGAIHTLLHLLVILGAIVLADTLISAGAGSLSANGGEETWQYYVVMLAACAWLGPFAVALYLWMMDLAGMHVVEASSAIRSTRYKSMLRMHFGDEFLEVHVVGIDRPIPGSDPVAHLVETFKVQPFEAGSS